MSAGVGNAIIASLRCSTSALHAAPPRLSSEERAAEAVFALMRSGQLSKDEYTRRMHSLERASPVAACYATYLLLRSMPPSSEKALQWERMAAQLRAALDEPAR